MKIIGIAYPIDLEDDNADQGHGHSDDNIAQIPVHDANLRRSGLTGNDYRVKNILYLCIKLMLKRDEGLFN